LDETGAVGGCGVIAGVVGGRVARRARPLRPPNTPTSSRRRKLQVLKIRGAFSILMSPRCHQVAEILKAVSPLLCLRLQTGCSARRPIGQPRQLDRAGTVAPLTRAAER
jgi:hypothetical protein